MSVIVSAGNSPYKVSANQTDTGDVVVSGGSMFVLSGGAADFDDGEFWWPFDRKPWRNGQRDYARRQGGLFSVSTLEPSRHRAEALRSTRAGLPIWQRLRETHCARRPPLRQRGAILRQDGRCRGSQSCPRSRS